MTVATEISANEYTGNGVTTDFDYKFRVFKESHLNVTVSNSTGDDLITLRLGTDYSVTGVKKSSGGKVILTRPLANGSKIAIVRELPITQETSFRNQSKFFAETHEDAFDYLTMLLQRMFSSLNSLYLKRPSFLANWFDAKGYRIANLGKPKHDRDAVNLGSMNEAITAKDKRSLRVADMDIQALPKASERADKVLTFDKDGVPQVIAPASGSAVDVLNQLASLDGSSMINTSNGDSVQHALDQFDSKILSIDYALYLNTSIIKNQLADGENIIFELFGDSTMWGSTAKNSLVKNPINPPDVLQQTFDLVYGPEKAMVINAARPGTSLFSLLRGSDGGMGTYEDRLKKSSADVIICNHGQNDCNSFVRTVEQYKEDLINFVTITRKHNKIPVLVTPNISAVFSGVTEKMTRRLPAFVDAMRKVASMMGVDLVDNYYYTFKATRVMSAYDIVPDGVHPSSDIYAVIGRNLAIPFVAARTLKKHGDIASLSNVSYRDTITEARNFRNADSLFSKQVSWDAKAATQTVFYPVILDNPTDDTIISFGGFQWPSGGKSKCNYNGDLADPRFTGEIDQFRGGSAVDQNAFYFPEVCNLLAGLHVIGLTNHSIVGGKATSFSGVALLNRNSISAGRYPYKKGFQLDRVISVGDEISFSCFVSSVSGVNQTLFMLTEVLDKSTIWLTIKKEGNTDKITIEQLGGSKKDVVTGIAGGEYYIRLKINRDRTVTISFGNTTVITEPAGYPLPTCYVSSRSLYFVTN